MAIVNARIGVMLMVLCAPACAPEKVKPVANPCDVPLTLPSGTKVRPSASAFGLFLKFGATLEAEPLALFDKSGKGSAESKPDVKRNVLSARLYPLAEEISLTGTAGCFEDMSKDHDLTLILALDDPSRKRIGGFFEGGIAPASVQGIEAELLEKADEVRLQKDGTISNTAELNAWGYAAGHTPVLHVERRDKSGLDMDAENSRKLWGCFIARAAQSPIRMQVQGALVVDVMLPGDSAGSLEIHSVSSIRVDDDFACKDVVWK